MRLTRADNLLAYTAVLVFLYLTLLPYFALAEDAHAATVNPDGAIAVEIRATLELLHQSGRDKPANLDVLTELYRDRGFQPLWCNDTGVTTAAHYWLSVLSTAEQQGITRVSNTRTELEARLNATWPSQLADLDLMLSDSFLQYAGVLANGQFNQLDADPRWHIQGAGIQPVKLIEQVAQSSQPTHAYRSLLPSHKSYQALHSALLRYLWIAESGGWPVLDARGQRLQSGDASDEIPQLRTLLWSLGDLPEDAVDGRVFDATLQRAVQRFQQRHGLDSDGVVGPRTRAALSVGVDQRIQQIRLNLERWRWLPRDLGERYILVNSAAFELQAHQAGSPPLTMRVVVGRKDRQTPVFSEDMRYLIVNPYWHVPGLLARRDLIPNLIDQPDYFFKRSIRVLADWNPGARELDPLAIDWEKILDDGHLPYKLRQDPGPDNALGRIKFMLPNRYNVYLHDTPGSHLFQRPVRTFSSGCVRVEKPLALANFVLGKRDTPQAVAELEALIGQGDTLTLSLPEPLPVYMLYQTAWVDESGDLQFRDDIYRRDRRLAALLKREKTPAGGTPKVKNTSVAQAIGNLP